MTANWYFNNFNTHTINICSYKVSTVPCCFKVKFTKQPFILLFMQKSVMPVAGNNITLMNVNGCAVISRHVEFVLS